MTPKEALIKTATWGHDKEHHELVCNSQEFLIVDNALTELEELRKDTARFMELISKLRDNKEDVEMRELRGKLSKVGKQE